MRLLTAVLVASLALSLTGSSLLTAAAFLGAWGALHALFPSGRRGEPAEQAGDETALEDDAT